MSFRDHKFVVTVNEGHVYGFLTLSNPFGSTLAGGWYGLEVLFMLCALYQTTRDSPLSPLNANITSSAQISSPVSPFAGVS